MANDHQNDIHQNDIDLSDADVGDAGVFADLELDATIDRNDFTPEHAIKVFEDAIEACKNETGDVLEEILDKGFKLLPIVIGLL